MAEARTSEQKAGHGCLFRRKHPAPLSAAVTLWTGLTRRSCWHKRSPAGNGCDHFLYLMGINVIRRDRAKRSKFIPAGFMGAIPGMASVATWMMKRQIDKAGMPTVEELLEMAQLEGVKFVACKMTMDMMELKPEDFIEGIEIQTAEALHRARQRVQAEYVHLEGNGW